MSGYSLDSSMLIEGMKRYPIGVFPSLWTRLGELAVARTVLVSEEVVGECGKKDDAIKAWLAQHRVCWVPTDSDVVTRLRQVQRACPHLPPPNSTKSQADPFVVAVALLHGAVVVTEEHMARKGEMPKIPNACQLVGVRCLNMVTFLAEQGWQF